MAVFTPVEEADAEPFISRYGLSLVALTPIAEGVENTNYRLDTDRGRFVLTLFEGRTDAAALPFCLGLTAHAADKGLPAGHALADHDGRTVVPAHAINGQCDHQRGFPDAKSPHGSCGLWVPVCGATRKGVSPIKPRTCSSTPDGHGKNRSG